jgi:hypothetical protein
MSHDNEPRWQLSSNSEPRRRCSHSYWRSWNRARRTGSFRIYIRPDVNTCSVPATLLLPRIVRWIHVIDILGAYTMKLDDGFFAKPGEVIGFGLDDCGATGGQRLRLFLIQLVSSPQIESARYHRDTLSRGMPMGRNLVVGGKLDPDNIRDRFVGGPSITANFAPGGMDLASSHLRSAGTTAMMGSVGDGSRARAAVGPRTASATASANNLMSDKGFINLSSGG